MKSKTLLLGLTCTIASFWTFAQPSDSEVKSKIRSNFKDPSKIVYIKLSEGGGRTDHEYENGAWVYNYYRSYETKQNTKYPGVTYIYHGSVKYQKSGSGYTFNNWLVGDGHYEGIPNPSESEVLEIISKNLPAYLASDYNDVVGDLSEVKIHSNPEWYWGDLNRVSVNTVVTFTEMVSYTDVEKRRVVKNITLFRSADGINYDAEAELLTNGKWLPLTTGMVTRVSFETLERRTLSEEELANTRSLAEIDMEKEAQRTVASLPPIDIPEFNSANHVIQYTHELLIEGDKNKVKAYLYKMLASFYFEEWSEVVLNRKGEDLVNGVLANLEHYKVVFCKHPSIKHQQDGMIQFYDRSKYRFNRIAVEENDGKWKVTAIEYGVPGTSTDEFASLKNAGEQNCGDAIDTSAPVALEKYSIGDKVQAQINGQWYNGEVNKIDNVMDDRYFVKFENINSKWITADIMRPWDGAIEDTPSGDDQNTTINDKDDSKNDGEFKVGDRVEGNWQGKGSWYRGTIKAKVGKRYLIHYDDGDTETTTVDKIRKI